MSTTSRPFFDVARDLRRGLFLDECADKLQEVVAAVDESGKPGKLVIEITIAPASKGQGAFKVADKVTVKLPPMPAGETIMFGTPEMNLVANDPRQGSLELKSVGTDRGAEPLRNVG
jgi:hypothetical protein